MELRLLRYFLTIVQEQNISRAASVLHITQPSLSKQLIDFEQSLGKQLFIRGKRKISLTEEGYLLYKRAVEILSLCDKTEQEIMNNGIDICGEISIGGALSPVVAKAAGNFLDNYPNIKFNFINGDAEKICQYLDNGIVDFGILMEPVDLNKYERLPLNETTEWGIVMHKDVPLAEKSNVVPEDLKGIPLIMHRRLPLQRQIEEWSGLNINELKIVATYDILFNNPLLLIKKQQCCAFTSSTQFAGLNNTDLCFRPLLPALKIKQSIVWKRNLIQSNNNKRFIEELQNILNIN